MALPCRVLLAALSLACAIAVPLSGERAVPPGAGAPAPAHPAAEGGVEPPAVAATLPPAGPVGGPWAEAVGLVASLLALPFRQRAARRRQRLIDRIDLLESQGDFAAAEPLARKLVGLSPDDPRAHFQWGVLLSKVGQPLKAMQCHAEAHRLLQAHPDPSLLVENAFAAALTAALDRMNPQAPHSPSYWIRELVKVRPRIVGELEAHGELRPWIEEALGDRDDETPFWLRP